MTIETVFCRAKNLPREAEEGGVWRECHENGYPDAPSYRDIVVKASTEWAVSGAGNDQS